MALLLSVSSPESKAMKHLAETNPDTFEIRKINIPTVYCKGLNRNSLFGQCRDAWLSGSLHLRADAA